MHAKRSSCSIVFFAHNALLLLGVWGHALEASSCQKQVYGKEGGTVVLSPGSGNENLTIAQWKYNGFIKVADIQADLPGHQFSGRVSLDKTSYILTVKELKTTDSGDFTFVSGIKGGGQRPTYCIRLVVQEVLTRPTLTVINKTNISNGSCVVLMECGSNSDRDVSYSWTVNNLNHNGSRLQYHLRTQEGDVTFTCDVSNVVSNASESKSINCQSSQKALIIVVIVGLCTAIIIAIIGPLAYCYCKKPKSECDDELTVYAEIDDVPSSKTVMPCSLYETVDIKPSRPQPKAQTVYDQIQFSRMQL